MTDHPEFPQESQAIQYIVDQVSKVEEASTCATGYYKSLSKIISRLDKTDVELNRLHQTTLDLKKITDADVIATVLGKKSDEIQETIYNGIVTTSNSLNTTIDTNLKNMRSDHQAIITMVADTDKKSKVIQHELENAVLTITERLDAHVKEVSNRLTPPLWKIWLYILLSLVVGGIIGCWLTKTGVIL
jgi:type I site-specific restriction endonuclease